MRVAVVVLAAAACGRLRFDPVSGTGTTPGDAGEADLGVHPDVSYTTNIVFVTSDNYVVGSFGSLAAADAICQQEAATATLPGTYRAWLSTSTTNAIDRLTGARGWVRPDGVPVVDLPADLVSGAMYAPIDELADGSRAIIPVITGTHANGMVDTTYNCADYTTTTGDAWGGSTDGTIGGFTDLGRFSTACGTKEPFYCFGVDRAVAPTLPAPAAGRRAFLSTPWTPSGGLAGADAHCQADATAAGRTGTYHALLATTTATAASRFDTGAATWVRFDGYALASSAADLMNGTLLVPLNETAAGSYLGMTAAYTWSGAIRPVTLATSASCADWTSSSPSKSGSIGLAEYADGTFFNHTGLQSCTSSLAVYCLEP